MLITNSWADARSQPARRVAVMSLHAATSAFRHRCRIAREPRQLSTEPTRLFPAPPPSGHHDVVWFVVWLRSLGCPVLISTLAVAVAPVAPAAPGDAQDRFGWPLRPRPAITRYFDEPRERWNRGHRGVDMAGAPDQRVIAAGPGIVVYAGSLAGRPLISIEHAGGLRTTYEPVAPLVKPGQRVSEGSVIGTLLPGHPGCPEAACLHWGALRGPASAADYLNPLGLLASTPLRLKPLTRD